MPRYIRMKKHFLQGLLWLYLTGFGFMALSLEPGFLDFDNLPDTNFTCVGKVIGGYYADLETNCQMFHVCTIGQLDEPMDIRFLCLNGTVFDQETRVCERIDEVDCAKSEQFYSLNLELYGNSQPAILEETADNTEPPIIIKSQPTTTTATTTSTTTTTTPRPKPSRPSYYTTIGTTHHPGLKHQHQYGNAPDIRYNPEEINVSLNPVNIQHSIQQKPTQYKQHYNDNANSNNKKVLVGLERPLNVQISTQKPKSVVSYELTHNPNQRHPATPADISYFTYGPTEAVEYQTQLPQHNYHYHSNVANFRPYGTPNKNNFRTNKGPTTAKTVFVHTFKPPAQYSYNPPHTEKPQRVQLPLPLLPTLPPITFSSPAPFTLTRHIETKRYTKEHHQTPPRIIISASASVSDDSGRRLNYSLGTIGSAELEERPQSYEDEADEEVRLEQFYHDVPKIKSRKRRAAQEPPQNLIKNEKEAVQVLKILVDWYKNNQETSSVPSPLPKSFISEINDELSGSVETSLAADDVQLQTDIEGSTKPALSSFDNSLIQSKNEFGKNKTAADYEYVDDNYEPLVYKEESNVTRNVELEKNRTVTSEPETLYTTAVRSTLLEEEITKESSTATSTTRKKRRRDRTRLLQLLDEIDKKLDDNTDLPLTETTVTTPINTHEYDYLPLTPIPTDSSDILPDSSDLVTDLNSNEVATDTDSPFVAVEVQENATEAIKEIKSVDFNSSDLFDQNSKYSILGEVPKSAENETEVVYYYYYDDFEDNYDDLKNETNKTDALPTNHSSVPHEIAYLTKSDNHSSYFNHSDVILDAPHATLVEVDNVTFLVNNLTNFSEVTSSTTSTTEQITTLAHVEEEMTVYQTSSSTTAPSRRRNPHSRGRTTFLNTIHEENTLTRAEKTTSTTLPSELANIDIPSPVSEYSTAPLGTTTTVAPEIVEETTVYYKEISEINETVPYIEEQIKEIHETVDLEKKIDKGNEFVEDPVIPEEIITTEKIDIVEETEPPTTAAPEIETTLHENIFETEIPPETSTEHLTKQIESSTHSVLLDVETKTTLAQPVEVNSLSSALPIAESTSLKEEELETTSVETTTVSTTTSTARSFYTRRTRPTRRRYDFEHQTRRKSTRHRFSSEARITTTPPTTTTEKPIPTSIETLRRYYRFNCFGKKLDKFYPDPRDCRLFHYCTQGYNSNQLLDMKFVCDLGTYFDDKRLICTKEIPNRCLYIV